MLMISSALLDAGVAQTGGLAEAQLVRASGTMRPVPPRTQRSLADVDLAPSDAGLGSQGDSRYAASLLMLARRSAASELKRLHLQVCDADDVASDAMLEFLTKPEAERVRYDAPEKLLVGIVKKLALRRASKRFSAQRASNGGAQERPNDSQGNLVEAAVVDLLDAAQERERGDAPGGETTGADAAAQTDVAMPLTPQARDRISSALSTMARAMTRGYPPALLAWLREEPRQRRRIIKQWCLGLLRLAEESDVGPGDESDTPFRDPRRVAEREKLATRAAAQLSQWLHQNFPNGDECRLCKSSQRPAQKAARATTGTVFDCTSHSVRTLLSVAGAPSQKERRGPPRNLQWNGWHIPVGSELSARYDAARAECASASKWTARLRGRLKSRGLAEELAEHGRAGDRLRAANAARVQIEDELDRICERRWIQGPAADLRQHRMELVTRSFQRELCRLLHLDLGLIDEVQRTKRAESRRHTEEVITQMKAGGMWPTRDRRKGGRPRQRRTKTRRRTSGNQSNT